MDQNNLFIIIYITTLIIISCILFYYNHKHTKVIIPYHIPRILKYDDNGVNKRINNIVFNDVPAVIYQVNTSRKIKNLTKSIIINNLQNNPEFDYYLYNNHDCREYIKNNFDENTLNAYDKLEKLDYHTELWKYCILYNNGGVYLDIDYNINTSLVNYIKTYPNAFVSSTTNPLIIVQPKSKILKYAINNIVNNIDDINTRHNLDNISLVYIINELNKKEIITMYINENEDIKDIETNEIICSL